METIVTGVQFIYYLVGTIIGLASLIGYLIHAQRRASAAVGRARDLAVHRTTLEGRVVATGELLRSPLTQRECVLYEMEILRINGEPVEDKKIPDFIIETKEERFFVYGSDVQVAKKFDFEANDPDPKYEPVLKKYGLNYYDWTVYKILQCRERLVVPGQTVTLSGSFDYAPANPRIILPLPGTKLTLDD